MCEYKVWEMKMTLIITCRQADTEGSAPTSLEHVTARNIIETCEQHMPICKATILILYYRNQY